MLRDLPNIVDPNLLVGYDGADDACVYRLSDELALVQTVDFFPPMVDDPYLFGQIAAANALSDVYAMGGRPITAMNLLCFPSCLDPAVARQILAGGQSKAAEAGAVVAGGHSIQDNEPKYGMCVTGLAHPRRILANCGAQPGDRLILTKPLGSGVLVTAAKGDVIDAAALQPAVAVMTRLNRRAAEIAAGFTIHACTDITGFGLLGHALEMAAGSGATLRLDSASLPLIAGARELARMGVIPAGAYTNRDHVGGQVAFADGLPQELADICFDPQTSGGLLLAVAEAEAEALLAALQAELPDCRIIGRAEAAGAYPLRLE